MPQRSTPRYAGAVGNTSSHVLREIEIIMAGCAPDSPRISTRDENTSTQKRACKCLLQHDSQQPRMQTTQVSLRVDERTIELRYTPQVEEHVSIKGTKRRQSLQMDPEDTMSERSQTQKASGCVTPFIGNVRDRETHSPGKGRGCRGTGGNGQQHLVT